MRSTDSFHSEVTIWISWLETPFAIYLASLWVDSTEIVNAVLSLVLFVDATFGIIGTEATAEGEFSDCILTMSFDGSSWLRIDLKRVKFHIVPWTILLILSFPHGDILLYKMLRNILIGSQSNYLIWFLYNCHDYWI